MTFEEPLYSLAAVTALRGQCGKPKHVCLLQHVATLKNLQPHRTLTAENLGKYLKPTSDVVSFILCEAATQCLDIDPKSRGANGKTTIM